MGQEAITLFQLNQRIKGIIDDALLTSIWVKAEIGELRVNRNGHCYLDLIEKSDDTDQLKARSRAMIWARNFRMLKAYFESTTGQSLTTGLKVLVKVSVQFQEVFGMSLVISDIDPSYTMGDLARKRREVLLKLEEEGVLEMNKELQLADVIQKIAIISSPTAAGYGDFVDQLETNHWGIKFYHHLFPAVMQGENAESSIAEAFDKVFEYVGFFDAVVLIRGGGASIDLLCFDSYWVAYHLAQFPLPVITGIGHERDESVADLVANTTLKTPTAVAAFLIERAGAFIQIIDEKSAWIADIARERLQQEKQRTENLASAYVPLVKMDLQKRQARLERQVGRLPVTVSRRLGDAFNKLSRIADKSGSLSIQIIRGERNSLKTNLQKVSTLPFKRFLEEDRKLKYLEQTAVLNDPVKLLKKGYSLSYVNGQLVKDVSLVKKGDQITTRISNGEIKGVVEMVNKKNNNNKY
ncbi:exodeoxyribonuclease VII large subunit [Marinilabilia rubra]|uniref:Exodeoxyribonuclease 7 large subunit n=1 Tax=Marinilabilia rubra TaxID=2162893 RepID=A0A2U2B7R5_9BACT|nr:exodeoxyribonuclease VII large subunit [Marinilabilia rubra]PWD99084.1 exodeoxyribonuclease VII large subunit [Marinilabilia rubra]